MITDGMLELLAGLEAAGAAVIASAVTGFITYRVTARTITAQASEGAAERQARAEAAAADRRHDTSERHAAAFRKRRLDAYLAVTRHVNHWGRQVEWALRKDRSRIDPPSQQPDPDSIDYEAQALVALVGSVRLWDALRDFDQAVWVYLSSRGSLRASHGTEAFPEALQRATDDGGALLASRQRVIDCMREEVRNASVAEGRALPDPDDHG